MNGMEEQQQQQQQQQQFKSKRNSTYVPVHRRSSSISDKPSFSQDDDNQQHLKRLSQKSQDTGNFDSRRSSRQFAWSRQQQQQQQQQQQRRYYDDGDDSDDVSFASTPANRFSRNGGGGSNSGGGVYYDDNRRSTTGDKLHYALENLLIHEEQQGQGQGQQYEWEELLRQYDRYEDVSTAIPSNAPISIEDMKAANRKSKRASRIMDPFNEPPGKEERKKEIEFGVWVGWLVAGEDGLLHCYYFI